MRESNRRYKEIIKKKENKGMTLQKFFQYLISDLQAHVSMDNFEIWIQIESIDKVVKNITNLFKKDYLNSDDVFVEPYELPVKLDMATETVCIDLSLLNYEKLNISVNDAEKMLREIEIKEREK